MTTKHIGTDTLFHFTRMDTTKWASKWPCSTLRGHDVDVVFDSHGDLADISVDGSRNNCDDIDGYELLCLVDDCAPKKMHPARAHA